MQLLYKLEHDSQQAQTLETRVKALNALSEALRGREPQRALSLSDEVLALIGNREDLSKAKADALLSKGIALNMLPDYNQALSVLQTARTLYESLNDKHGIATSLKSIGNAYFCLADYSTALDYYQQSLALRQELADKRGIANSLNSIGDVYEVRADYTTALDYYQQSLALRQEIGDTHDIAASLNSIGNVCYYLANYPTALEHYQQSLTLFEEIDDKPSVAKLFHNIGLVYQELGDYPNALHYFQQSFMLKQELGDKRSAASTLNSIGNIYFYLADYSHAREYYEQSLALSQENSDKPSIANLLHNIGNVYKAQADYPNALAYHEQSLAHFREMDDKRRSALVLGSLGTVYEQLSDYSTTLRYYQQSLEMAQAIGDRHGVVSMMHSIGSCFLKLGMLDDAESAFNQAFALAHELGLKDKCYQTLKSLANLYAQLGKYELAYQMHVRFHETECDVLNAEAQRQLVQLQVRFETQQAKRLAELNAKEAELQRIKNVELAAALAEAQVQRQRAEEANRLKSELLAVAAHDLKNPLQSIMGFAQLLAFKSADPGTVRKYAKTIESSSDRMLMLVTDLLKSMRYEMTNIELHKQPYDLSEIMSMVVQNNLAQLERKMQVLSLELEPGCVATIDVARIQEVFDNLLSNAIKYTPSGKRISVALRRVSTSEQTYFQASVKDEGQGLTEEDKAKLFGRFQRLSARPTGGESSTGLGLYIVKQIVELHGGKVWAESDGEGKGATFVVELPA